MVPSCSLQESRKKYQIISNQHCAPEWGGNDFSFLLYSGAHNKIN